MPHLEFTVPGPPVSQQTRDRANLSAWKNTIRTEAALHWGATAPLTGKLKCTIINFHESTVASLDDDNMVKPIRDAMNGLVYADDSQITYSETIHVSIDAPIKLRRASTILLAAYSRGDEFLYIRIDTTRPISSSSPSDAMEQQAIEKLARRYRDEGYDVLVHPRGDQIPPFLAGFDLDMIATRGNESVVVAVKTSRIELSNHPDVARFSEVVNSQPGWRLDVVILEQESQVERAAQEASEPSDEQLAQILKTADDLTDQGHTSYACVIGWSGLEAAMRRIRDGAERYGQTTANELMRALYGNGFLSREQFDRLKESYKIRNQVVHGLVPPPVDPELVHDLTATARYLVNSGEAAVPAN